MCVIYPSFLMRRRRLISAERAEMKREIGAELYLSLPRINSSCNRAWNIRAHLKLLVVRIHLFPLNLYNLNVRRNITFATCMMHARPLNRDSLPWRARDIVIAHWKSGTIGVYIYTHLYTRAQIARDSFFFFVSIYIDVDFAHSVHTCRLYFRDERARAFDVSIGALPNREGAAQFPRQRRLRSGAYYCFRPCCITV